MTGLRTLALRTLGLSTILFAGCGLVTDIDVCERTGRPEIDLNRRTEGAQFAEPGGLSRIPGSGALLAFTSATSDTAEVRRARVSADGSSLPTCEVQGEPTVPALSDARTTEGAAVAFGDMLSGEGLLVHRDTRADGRQRLWARPVSENGCVDGFGARPPLFVAEAATGAVLFSIHATPLGGTRFVISWTEFFFDPARLEVHSAVMARVLDLRTGLFLPTHRARDGEAAALPPDGDVPIVHAVVAMGEGRFGALWYESAGRTRLRFAVFDDRLAVVHGPIVVHDVRQRVPDGLASAAVAFDGEQVFLAWVLGDERDGGRVLGAFMTADARPLSAERAAPGEWVFRLGSAGSASETGVTATALPGGGFLAAWTERDTTTSAGASESSVRALGLSRAGEVLFANRACERTDFLLALDADGSQERPLLATLDDATILLVYTNDGGVSNDRSGTGLRAVGLRREDLFPR